MSFRLRFASLFTAAVVLVPASSRCAATTGKEIFEDKCAPCHGVDGKARTPAGKKLGAKDLSLSQLTDAEIERQVREGSKDKRGAEKMPPFKDKVTAADIPVLVTYVKTFRPH